MKGDHEDVGDEVGLLNETGYHHGPWTTRICSCSVLLRTHIGDYLMLFWILMMVVSQNGNALLNLLVGYRATHKPLSCAVRGVPFPADGTAPVSDNIATISSYCATYRERGAEEKSVTGSTVWSAGGGGVTANILVDRRFESPVQIRSFFHHGWNTVSIRIVLHCENVKCQVSSVKSLRDQTILVYCSAPPRPSQSSKTCYGRSWKTPSLSVAVSRSPSSAQARDRRVGRTLASECAHFGFIRKRASFQRRTFSAQSDCTKRGQYSTYRFEDLVVGFSTKPTTQFPVPPLDAN
eukprot:scaffold151156_cov33-Attheya_sp.AAC.2